MKKLVVRLMFHLRYADRLDMHPDEFIRFQEALSKHGEAELLKHGIRHKIMADCSKLLSYEPRFE